MTTATPEVTKNHFGDLDQVVANYGDLESAERIDDMTLELRFKPQRHGPRFQGNYTCRFQVTDEQTLSSSTIGDEGNMGSYG